MSLSKQAAPCLHAASLMKPLISWAIQAFAGTSLGLAFWRLNTFSPFNLVQGGDKEACTAAQSEAHSSPAPFHVSAQFTCSSSFTCSSFAPFRQAHLSAALAIGSAIIGNHPVSGRLPLLLIHEERILS